MKDGFDELIAWYRDVYTPQMVNGSNIPADRMRQNLSVVEDAVFSYREAVKP